MMLKYVHDADASDSYQNRHLLVIRYAVYIIIVRSIQNSTFFLYAHTISLRPGISSNRSIRAPFATLSSEDKGETSRSVYVLQTCSTRSSGFCSDEESTGGSKTSSQMASYPPAGRKHLFNLKYPQQSNLSLTSGNASSYNACLRYTSVEQRSLFLRFNWDLRILTHLAHFRANVL